jgi:hypothetical protein
VLFLTSIAAAGSIYSYKSTLTPGGETPKPKAPAAAKGSFTGSVTENGSTRTFKWKLTFSGLSGKAVAAHVHKGKSGVAGAVIIPLCGPCKSGQTGTMKISTSVADVLEHGATYVNVHTAKNAGGEIRGQVKLTGEDSSASASASGQANPPATTTPGTTTGDDSGYSY